MKKRFFLISFFFPINFTYCNVDIIILIIIFHFNRMFFKITVLIKKIIIIKWEQKGSQNNKGWSDIIMQIHCITSSTQFKDLFSCRWGNPPVLVISHFNLIKFT